MRDSELMKSVEKRLRQSRKDSEEEQLMKRVLQEVIGNGVVVSLEE